MISEHIIRLTNLWENPSTGKTRSSGGVPPDNGMKWHFSLFPVRSTQEKLGTGRKMNEHAINKDRL